MMPWSGTVSDCNQARVSDGHLGIASKQHHVGSQNADHEPKHVPEGPQSKAESKKQGGQDLIRNYRLGGSIFLRKPLDWNGPVVEVLTLGTCG